MDANELAWMDEMARRDDAKLRAEGRAKLKENKAAVKEETEARAIESRRAMVRRGAEGAPEAQFFNNEKGIYVPNLFAKWVIGDSSQNYICIEDSDEVFYYDRGVYKPRGDLVIEESAMEIMDGKGVNPNSANATVFAVKRRVGVMRREIDGDENMVNVLNGIYNLKTGEIGKHSPEHLSVKQMNVVFDAEATCPRIDKFLHEIMSGEDVKFAYELFGYTLLPSKDESTAVFFEGRGANGKSVLMKLMKQFVGADTTSGVSPNDMKDDRYAIADLFGAALNVVDDLGNDVIEGVGAFKSVITGDGVRGQHKYGQPFTFDPNLLCVFGCNEVPQSLDTSDGYYRRMRIISFPNRFEGAGDNKKLIYELCDAKEISGLFNVAVSAIRDVLVRGEFTGNMSVDEKRKAYVMKASPLLMFLEERCDTTSPNNMVSKNALFNAYVLWCKNNNLRVRSKGEMTSTYQESGIVPSTFPRDEDGHREPCYKGVRLRAGDSSGDSVVKRENDCSRRGGDSGDSTPPYCSDIDKDICNIGATPLTTVTTTTKTRNEGGECVDYELSPLLSPPNSPQSKRWNPDATTKDYDDETAEAIRAVLKTNLLDGCGVEYISKTTGIFPATIDKHLTSNRLNVEKVGNGCYRMRG